MFAPNGPAAPLPLRNASPVAGALPAPPATRAMPPPAQPAACRRLPSMIDISRIEGRCANPPSSKVGEVVSGASRRSAGDHPHLAASTGIIMSRAAKTAVKDDIRPSPGAERAAIMMLALGEEHSPAIWKHDGRGRDQGSLPGDVQSRLGLLHLIEKLLVDFVSQMSGTGSLMGSYESTERLLARIMPEDKVGRSWKKSAVPPAAPCGTSWPM
jgi:hypothetical protein